MMEQERSFIQQAAIFSVVSEPRWQSIGSVDENQIPDCLHALH